MNVLKVGEKGANLWVENARNQTYVQCLNCGHIHIIDRKIPMSISVIKSWCPKCEWIKGLNCGYDEMDVMELKDPYIDARYL